MIKLSDRLQAIANLISPGETIADIGTDHGFLPISLWEKGICPHVVLSDIKNGPLDKARENIKNLYPDEPFDIRMGSGLSTIEKGEIDTIIIAGMGGLLITEILGEDLGKTKSYKKFLLQPRNAPDKLRAWLFENHFEIMDEVLVREGKYICEIISAVPSGEEVKSKKNKNDGLENPLVFEISPLLFTKKDPLLVEFIKNKLKIENKIIKEITEGANDKENKKIEASRVRITQLQTLLKRSLENEYEF